MEVGSRTGDRAEPGDCIGGGPDRGEAKLESGGDATPLLSLAVLRDKPAKRDIGICGFVDLRVRGL